jgi:hypothetical protein
MIKGNRFQNAFKKKAYSPNFSIIEIYIMSMLKWRRID